MAISRSLHPRAPWVIGIYRGNSLTSLTPSPIPALTADSVTDRDVSFVADPMLVRRSNSWHLFFEMYDRRLDRGVIGHASSTDTVRWDYTGCVLEEPFHLSYPHAFEHAGEMFMIPESKRSNEVRLYRATSFPSGWKLERVLLRGRYTDPSLFFANGYFWLMLGMRGHCLRLFYARDILGPWKSHVRRWLYIYDKKRSRPGGPPVECDGDIVRFSQDSTRGYGYELRAFRIRKLSRYQYVEEDLTSGPFLRPGSTEWNTHGVHTIAPVRLPDGTWIAAADGAAEANSRYPGGSGRAESRSEIASTLESASLSHP